MPVFLYMHITFKSIDNVTVTWDMNSSVLSELNPKGTTFVPTSKEV